MRGRTGFLYLLLFVVLFFSSGWTGLGENPQDPVSDKARIEKTEAAEDTIVPGPENIKQKIALYVFVTWLWINIGVCLFFLRLKIKEADRLHSLDYFSEDNP